MARASGGLTRRINILADKALLAAFAEDAFDVGKRHVKIAVNDSQFVRIRRWGLPEFSLISGLVLIVAAVSWTFAQRSDAVSERLGQWLPGGATQTMSQPAANQEQSGDQANAVAMPESAPTNRQAVLAADASSSAVADDRPLASVAAGSGVIARTTGATDGQSREQDGGSGTQAQAARGSEVLRVVPSKAEGRLKGRQAQDGSKDDERPSTSLRTLILSLSKDERGRTTSKASQTTWRNRLLIEGAGHQGIT